MLNRLLNILDLIFPEREDHRVVRLLSEQALLNYLNPTTHPPFTSLLPFNAYHVRSAIHEAKFHRNEKSWDLLATVLAEYLKTSGTRSILLPIPLSAKRQKQRGYNQVIEVARRAIIKRPEIILEEGLLIRVRDTAPQTTLKRHDRLLNVVDAFKVNDGSSLTQKDIIILDDVATTGATLKAAEASLRPLNPRSITLLSLAH